ncbi:MAG: response regulator [bacterium]|nr:response regulator [bacterium]
MNNLSRSAKIYVWSVVVTGVVASIALVASNPFAPGELTTFAAFGMLAGLATSLTISYRGAAPTRISHQIGTSFVYPLLVLVHPAFACIVLYATTLIDRQLHRRAPLSAAFNLGQLGLSVAAAALVASLLQFESLATIGPRGVAGALGVVLAFAATNHLLTMGAISLANRRPFLRWTWFMRMGLLNEGLCIASGLGMAIFWRVSPWLVPLGVIPIWIMAYIVRLLNQREQSLESRENELQSLQGLGLEIGAELDAELLRDAVLRIACDALRATDAMLALQHESGKGLVVMAHLGMATPPPERLFLTEFEERLVADGAVVRLDPLRQLRGSALDALMPNATGMLVAPLEIRGKREGLLVLSHDESRRPFGDDDALRLETLVPFVDVALSNARLVTDLKTMQSQLVQTEKMSALGMLVAGVAHELNNPLTSVLGFAELLASDETDSNKYEKLQRITSEAKRAGRIVQSLLTFSRKHKPERRFVEINDLVREVLDFRSYEMRVRNISVVQELAPRLPAVLGDPHQLQQVLLNLITNAEHAIEESGHPGTIRVATAAVEGRVQIHITDDGPGIRDDELDQVFLPFFSTKEVGRGTGLGLSICYGIIEENGGKISVRSRPGEGATFSIQLPGIDREEGLLVHSPRRHPEHAPPEFRGRLLVLDDEESIVHFVTEYFGDRGWTVLAAREGSEALRLVEQVEFDVLLVDLRMPGMDGAGFFDRLQQRRPELCRRVVFATGLPDVDLPPRLLNSENPVLYKPYDLTELGRIISTIVATEDSGSGTVDSVS